MYLAGEPVDFMKDSTGVFEPTDEWKTVEPGKLFDSGGYCEGPICRGSIILNV